MPIPVFKIPIDLIKDTPSKVTPEELKKELNDIGLRCGETRVEKLEQYIKETLDQFPDGKVQGFGIYEYQPPSAEEFFEKGFTTKPISDLAVSIDDLHSNWKPDDVVPYMTRLAVIGVPEHFDCLKEKYTGFAGCKQSQTYDENDTTVNAVKSQFTRIATSISSTLIDELDKNQMEAVFSKIIAPVDPGNANYDSGLQNRNIYLVKGYTERECEAIGIINVEYQLKIDDYKDKKTLHKSYHLDVTVRTSLYNDLNPLYAEVEFIKSIFKNAMFFSKFSIPLNVDVKIYDTLPPACEDTFIHSLPLEQTQNDIISTMVVYAPDLENIGCIDNTGSDGQAQYSKTITSGFTFTAGQKISGGFKYGAGALFSKAEFNINFEISFTEQWNSSQSETVTFTVPKDSKAFLYQGYLRSAVLEFNTKTFQYSYKDQGRFLSNIIKTTPKPIDTKPVKLISERVSQKMELMEELPLWETI